MTRTIFGGVAALLLLTAGSAFADLTPIGGPVEGGSWAQRFEITGVGNFDLVAVTMTSPGDAFESPTHSEFDNDDWALLVESPSGTPLFASAGGPTVDYLDWRIGFSAEDDNPLEFDLTAFNSLGVAGSWHVSWDGTGETGDDGWTITPIPAPAALLLGAIGLGLAGWLKRRVA